MMQSLLIPQHLKAGDKVAAVSLSWGGAGEELFHHRYETGKQCLKDNFGIELVPMENTLKGADFIRDNPQARADDLHQAFLDPQIKGIIACIGGEDSIRIIEHVRLDIIRSNPKIFMGYSDSTVTNFICLAAGIRSFNGPAIMTQFAENGGMHDYSRKWIEKTLFTMEPLGEIESSAEGWTVEKLKWEDQSRQNQKRTMEPQSGWNYIQGDKPVTGPLIGGCTEVLGFLAGSPVWPKRDIWNKAILFIENSEDAISSDQFRWYLRNFQAQGILRDLAGIAFAKPCRVPVDQWTDYDEALKQLTHESGRPDMPIVTQMDFGHTDPIFIMPMGAMATIDPVKQSFSINEPGCAPRI
jgi:muramoyltetrapeptide carboxypeptidase LdcA involved in peptidoglycan recycling